MREIVQTRQFDHDARTTYILRLDCAPMSSTTSGMRLEQGSGPMLAGCGRTLLDGLRISLLLLTAACGFPRPADVGDDTSTGCARDQDCGGTTPFCVDTVCSVCRS